MVAARNHDHELYASLSGYQTRRWLLPTLHALKSYPNGALVEDVMRHVKAAHSTTHQRLKALKRHKLVTLERVSIGGKSLVRASLTHSGRYYSARERAKELVRSQSVRRAKKSVAVNDQHETQGATVAGMQIVDCHDLNAHEIGE